MQELPVGGPKVVGLPIAFDRVRPKSARPAPRLGEHTDEVLRAAATEDDDLSRTGR